MKIHLLFIVAAVYAAEFSESSRAAAPNPALDWPCWRGPTRDGIAASSQNPPSEWSETTNLLWQVPLPGRGHGSPCVVGNRIYVATADVKEATQSVICLDRKTGEMAWSCVVHEGALDQGGHRNTSQASSTIACDGERLYVNFLNGGGIHTTSLDLNGKKIWQEKICDFVTHQGFGSSPVLHESLVLVSADHRGGGTLAGLDRRTGKASWKVSRPKIANYTTPAIIRGGNRTQMVLAGCNRISSFNPSNGEVLWELDGSTEECVITMVSDGERVFASGGYPRNHTVAVMADGSKTIAWQNPARVYVPSMIAKAGYLYAVMDAGVAVCWNSKTGEELWKERLGGDFYSSPVRVGNRMYATSLAGITFVFEATPESFKLIARNPLGDECYPSPAICGGRIYLRGARIGEKREEFLACIGGKN